MPDKITKMLCKKGSAFVKNIQKMNFDKFCNIMPLLKPFTEIKLKDGYLLDAFYDGEKHGAFFKLYVCKENAAIKYEPKHVLRDSTLTLELNPKYIPFNENMVIEGLLMVSEEEIPSIYNYFEIPPTEMGFFEVFLLHIAEKIMPRWWHANYDKRRYIFQFDDLNQECLAFMGDESVLPHIELTQDEGAIITCTYWNMFSGLKRTKTRVYYLNDELRFILSDSETLVKYNCGIRF